jgi:hypothetical protein
MAAICPHQLIVQLLDACLKAGVLLKKLLVALLNVLNGAVLGLQLTSALLQAEVQVSARCCDLLKQGAHVLGVACCKRPICMMGRKLRVTNGGYALTPHHVSLIPKGEQGDGAVAEDRQVAPIELCEVLVGSPL